MVFPLPLDFFPPLRLSPFEAQSFRQWGDSLVQQTIDAYHCEQFDTQETRERKWKPLKHKHDLTVYKRRTMPDQHAYKYLCTGRIDGTLDEVVMGRYADNTLAFRRLSGVYREDIVDCAVLGVIQKRTADDPFFLSCFKWMTVASPGKGLVKNRDVCWYEQIGMTRDCNGKEIGYTLTESVELPTCPLFHECVRAKFSICYLYKRNKSGGVKVYMRGKNDAGGKAVHWVTDIKSAELWLRIERAMPVAHAVIATAFVQAGKKTKRPVIATPGICTVCHAKVSGFLSSSKQCAVCHRPACSSCVAKVRVLNFHDFRVPHHEIFCKTCFHLIHQVDLRAPENVKNPIAYATSILAGPESSKTSSLRSKEASRYTDECSEGAEEESVQYEASGTNSCSSNSSSSFPSHLQPAIGMKSQGHDEEALNLADSRALCPLLEHPGEPTHTNGIKSKPSTVTFYDKPVVKKTRRSTDACAGQRHHSQLPLCSADDQYFAGRESETPLIASEASARVNNADVYCGSVDSCMTYDSSASNSSTGLLMTQIVQMNLIE